MVSSHLPDVLSAEIGTCSFERLPRLHRVGPSVSLDEYILLREFIMPRSECQIAARERKAI